METTALVTTEFEAQNRARVYVTSTFKRTTRKPTFRAINKMNKFWLKRN
jgi:hypothetical protein